MLRPAKFMKSARQNRLQISLILIFMTPTKDASKDERVGKYFHLTLFSEIPFKSKRRYCFNLSLPRWKLLRPAHPWFFVFFGCLFSLSLTVFTRWGLFFGHFDITAEDYRSIFILHFVSFCNFGLFLHLPLQTLLNPKMPKKANKRTFFSGPQSIFLKIA